MYPIFISDVRKVSASQNILLIYFFYFTFLKELKVVTLILYDLITYSHSRRLHCSLIHWYKFLFQTQKINISSAVPPFHSHLCFLEADPTIILSQPAAVKVIFLLFFLFPFHFFSILPFIFLSSGQYSAPTRSS